MSDKKRIGRTNYKMMGAVLNQCARKNMGKAVFALLISNIIQTVFMVLAIMPVINLSLLNESGAQNMAISFKFDPKSIVESIIFIIMALLISNLLLYGLIVLMSRMVEKKYVTIGFLFSGFREGSRIVRAAIVYVLIFFVGVGISGGIAYLLKIDISTSVINGDISSKQLLYISMTVIINIALELPFIFVWPILRSDKNIKVAKAFGLSARMIFGRVFHFIGFVFFAGGINLIITVVATVLYTFIPNETSEIMQIVSMLLNIIMIASEYMALVRMYMSLPIYFYSLTGVMHVYTE